MPADLDDLQVLLDTATHEAFTAAGGWRTTAATEEEHG
jgi:hypothetical protein